MASKNPKREMRSRPADKAVPAILAHPEAEIETPATPAEAIAELERAADQVEADVTSVAAESVETFEETANAVTQPASTTDADTASKETTTMATTFENATTQPTAMLGDLNDRAKTAFTKGSKFVEEMNEFAKGNVEAMVESTRIAAKGVETMGQDAAEYSRKSFESATAALKSLATVKSPTEFFKLHSDYVRTSFDSAVAEASKSTEMMIKLAGDAVQPISNRFAVAVEKVKTAA